MSGKVRQRGILALIIYFLMITAIWAPIAFYTGRARGESEAQKPARNGVSMSSFETGADLSGTGAAELPLALPLAIDHTTVSGPAAIAAPVRRNRVQPGPLGDAVLRTVADSAGIMGGNGPSNDGPSNSQSGQDAPYSDPINLALAPSLPSLTGGLSQGGGQGAGQGGAASSPNGYPGALVPAFLAGDDNPATGPQEPPPALVTPVPAALPLMLTGLGGLFAAARRRRAG